MLSFALHALFAIAAAPTGALEIVGTPAPFALEEGFVEVVPDAPLVLQARGVGDDEELVVDLVRIGKLGKGRAKATVTAGKLKRTLAVLAPTLKERKLGRSYASAPLRQRAPLPAGDARVEIRVDAPMAMRVGVEKRAAVEPLALVPLSPTSAPPPPATAPPATPLPATALPATPLPATPLPATALPATAPPATALPATAPPATALPATAPATHATTPPGDVAAAPAAEPRTLDVQPRTLNVQPRPVAGAPRTIVDAAPAASAAGVETTWLPRLLAEVRAGTSAMVGGLQTFVPGGGARVLLGPRNLDAALGVAIDFDGQSSFIDVATPTGDASGSWQTSSTRLRVEGHLGVGDLALFEARLGVTAGAGARLAWHTASAPGVLRELFVVGATARIAPETSFPAGPGRFAISFPLDATIDVSPDVSGFAPLAAGVFLGYRLDL